MTSQNQVAPRLELILPLFSASQRPVGNQLTISISDYSLEDLREESFLAIALNKSSVIVCQPQKRSQLEDCLLVLTIQRWLEFFMDPSSHVPPQLNALRT
jgi:hypothetical protein